MVVKPIHYACTCGNLELLLLLLENGADASVQTEQGIAPVHLAAGFGHIALLEVLVENGADIYVQEQSLLRQPIHDAALGGHAPVVKWLLERGASGDAQTLEGAQPIHMGAIYGHMEVIKHLLDEGVDINVPIERSEGRMRAGMFGVYKTPAEVAAYIAHQKMLPRKRTTFKWLICHGAEVPDRFHHVKEVLASTSYDKDKYFSELIGDPARRTGLYMSLSVQDVFKMAAGQGNSALARYIIEHYGDMLIQEDYEQAFEGTVYAGHVGVVRLLRPYINDEAIIDSALRTAAQRGHQVLVAILEDNWLGDVGLSGANNSDVAERSQTEGEQPLAVVGTFFDRCHVQ